MGLPVGLFLFQLEGLPCLCSGGRGQWMQSLAGRSVLRDGYLVPFRDSSLTLPGVVYDAPGVLALGSGLAASTCRQCLRIALGPGPGFPVVSS